MRADIRYGASIQGCCAQQVEVNVEQQLIVILLENEQILIVTKRCYRPSVLLVPCHSAGSCPADPRESFPVHPKYTGLRISTETRACSQQYTPWSGFVSFLASEAA